MPRSLYAEAHNAVCIKREFPTARKEHQCTRCGKPILPNETYMREIWRHLNNGKTHSTKLHLKDCSW